MISPDHDNARTAANLSRRIKQHVLLPEHKLTVIPPPGLKDVCVSEIEQIIGGLIHPGKYQPQVSLVDKENEILVTPLDFRAMVQLPYQSLTAQDMLWELAGFRADTMALLDKGLSRINWPCYLPAQAAVVLKVDSRGSWLFHESMLKTHLTNILTTHGYRVVQEADMECFHLELIIRNNRACVRLSLASQPLYQRGYRRQFTATAPLGEHMAAALIRQFWGWMAHRQDKVFKPQVIYVPMAGSGTLAFEALCYLGALPSGLWGRRYGMEQIPCFVANHFNYIKKQLGEQAVKRGRELWDGHLHIEMSDMVAERITEERENLTGFLSAIPGDAQTWHDSITLREEDFFEQSEECLNVMRGKTLFMPLNPPYGVRLNQRSSSYDYYKKLATRICAIAARYDLKIGGFVLAADEDAWRALKEHLRGFQHKSRHFMQGGRDVRILNFTNIR